MVYIDIKDLQDKETSNQIQRDTEFPTKKEWLNILGNDLSLTPLLGPLINKKER